MVAYKRTRRTGVCKAATMSDSPAAVPVTLEPGQTLLAYLKDRISTPAATATKPSLTDTLEDPAFTEETSGGDDRIYALNHAEVLLWRAYAAYRQSEQGVKARIGAARTKTICDTICEVFEKDLSSVDINGGLPLTRWGPPEWDAFQDRLRELVEERSGVQGCRNILMEEAEKIESEG